MKKLTFILALVAVVALLVTACAQPAPAPAPSPTPAPAPSPAPAPAPAKTVLQLNQGSTSSTSGSFVYSVGLAKVINKYNPDLNTTIIESGATYANLRQLQSGVFDWSGHIGSDAMYEMYAGLDPFKAPYKELRALFIQENKVMRNYVRKDANATVWGDLKGKRFAPGIPGSVVSDSVIRTNEALGNPVELWYASLGDSVDATAAGRAVGVAKSSPIDAFDPGIVQLNLTTPMTVVGYSKAEVDKIQQKWVYFAFKLTKKGTIKAAPDFEGYERYFVPGSAATTRMSQQVGYEIVKAVSEHWDEVTAVYTSGKLHKNPTTEFVDLFPATGHVPFHAGAVQYMKEIGYNVPAWAIPPEYVEKK